MFSGGLKIDERLNEATVATSRWLYDLAGLVPASLVGAKGTQIILSQAARGMRVLTIAEGKQTLLGTYGPKVPPQEIDELKAALAKIDLASADAVLRLSSAHVLQREMRLPKAARDVLEPVIANQMDEITPWRQAGSVFGYQVVDGSDKEAGDSDKLIVNVVATSRKIIDDALASAHALGLEPRIVEYLPADGGASIVIQGTNDPSRIRLAERIGRMLSSFVVLMTAVGGVGLAIMLWQQSTLVSLEEEAGQHRARLAAMTRRDAPSLKLLRQSREIAAVKSSRPSMLITLEALSRALPDSAWLTNLEVRGDEVRIRGKAESAPELIAELEKLPYFENVQFSAPTTRAENDPQETFAITARMLPVTSLE